MNYYGSPNIVKPSTYGNNMVQGRVINNSQPGFMGAAQPPPKIPIQQPKQIRTVYAQMTTKNKSFLDMHHYLKSIGVKNNKFMLTLIDPDLDGIDPYDPSLNAYYKQKVLREVMCNYWYFIREVARVPSAGGVPMRYELTRGNLALNFCLLLNLSVFFELPRQCGKTVSTLMRLLYVYNFGTTNSKMAFLHKGADGAKDNLQTLKNLRDLLPPYLIFKERMSADGKVDRGKDNMTEIVNPFNNNAIKTYASATNKAKAASLLRGKSLAIVYMDEMGFIPFNDVIYSNMVPAFKITADNARKNGAPYGIIMTTTPGFMNSDAGKVAYEFKEEATPFSETWYDMSYDQLMNIISTNTKSTFVYIKYSYQQLGKSEAWFQELVRYFRGNWNDIKREILLQWSTGVENSPFRKEDLDAIEALVRQPISQTYLLGKYRFDTYLQADTMTYPPIIGVDVAAGYKQDSSTITIIDSLTTKVLGCLNCNYISAVDLARCIEYIVKNWMPNSIVNIERNGEKQSCIKRYGLKYHS